MQKSLLGTAMHWKWTKDLLSQHMSSHINFTKRLTDEVELSLYVPFGYPQLNDSFLLRPSIKTQVSQAISFSFGLHLPLKLQLEQEQELIQDPLYLKINLEI